jgi:hypothetical protein
VNSIDFNNIEIKKIECEVWPYDQDSTEDIQTGPTFLQTPSGGFRAVPSATHILS